PQCPAVARLDLALPPADGGLRPIRVPARGARPGARPGGGVSAKRVVITGAASGIGAATAAELRSRGARVVGLDVKPAGDDVIACDVRDQASVDRGVAEAIDRLGGGLDVLINNAGISSIESTGAPPDERALAVIHVNMLGAWRVTAAA